MHFFFLMLSDNDTIPAMGLVVVILVLASSTSIMSTDMYAPSLPDLTQYFNTTATRIKLTISLNMVAFGVAQLIHGPLSDRFGRRPVLLVSLIGVAILSLACAVAQSVEQLIVARIFLGLVAAAEAVIGLAILKDLYTEKEQVKALAMLGMAIAIAPAAAPILGGYLHVTFGWQSNFIVVAAMAILSFFVILHWLPESTTPDMSALNIRLIGRRYAILLRNAEFLIHSIIMGIGLGLIFVFVTSAPFILIERLGVAVENFGYYQASIVCAFFLGSALASQLSEQWSADRLLYFGVTLVVVGAVVLLLLIFTELLLPWRMAAAYAIMTFGLGPLFAVAPSRALRSITGQAGSASALLSGIEQLMAGFAAVAVSIFHDGSAQPMGWVTLILVVLLVVLIRKSRRLQQSAAVALDQ